MIKAKSRLPAVPKLWEKALNARVPPSVPLVQFPLKSTETDVMEADYKGIKNTSKEPQSPCATGWGVLAEEWIIEVPQPASLEYTERAIPTRIISLTAQPAKPPMAAVPVNAFVTMVANTEGTLERFARIMPIPIKM